MAKHIIKAAASVNCNRGNGEEDPESMLVAFWDGESKGTGHMVDLAKKYNMKYVKIFQGGCYAR